MGAGMPLQARKSATNADSNARLRRGRFGRVSSRFASLRAAWSGCHNKHWCRRAELTVGHDGDDFWCGGEDGIRTHETLLESTPLAGERLRPLGHLSGSAVDKEKRSDNQLPAARWRLQDLAFRTMVCGWSPEAWSD